MTLNDRDKKIMLFILPALLVGVYWFLILAPKRSEAGDLADQLAKVQQKRDDAKGRADELEGAKASYARDYATVVRVSKAIPSALDMPSLIVLLDSAAKGTGIRFKRIKAGTRADAPAPPTPTAQADKAASGPGKARDKAQAGAATSDKGSAASGAAPAGAAAGPPAGSTGGAATGTAGAAGSTSGVVGLDSVPLEFTFTGSFFDMSDFFHRMKRFVRVANRRVKVEGRLMTIDGFSFESSEFPTLKTEVQATVYLSPKAEGTTAGGSPSGPAPATQEASGTAPPAPGADAPAPTPPAGAPAPASSTGGTQ